MRCGPKICPGARRGAASAAALALPVAVMVGDSEEPEPAAIASRQAAHAFQSLVAQGARRKWGTSLDPVSLRATFATAASSRMSRKMQQPDVSRVAGNVSE